MGECCHGAIISLVSCTIHIGALERIYTCALLVKWEAQEYLLVSYFVTKDLLVNRMHIDLIYFGHTRGNNYLPFLEYFTSINF